MAKKRPTPAEVGKSYAARILNDPEAAAFVNAPKKRPNAPAADDAGKLVVARESVSVRFRPEQLQKVRLFIATHRAETSQRITLQEAIETGLQLWMDQRGIK
jgi:hypothetical protein